MTTKFKNFKAFYPHYLSQHQNLQCKRLHFIGTLSVIFCAFSFLVSMNVLFLLLMPLVGYGCAWIGHFYFEKNKPATFSHPLYSLMGDFLMFWQVITHRISLK